MFTGLMFHGAVVLNSHRRIISGVMARQRRMESLEGRQFRFEYRTSQNPVII